MKSAVLAAAALAALTLFVFDPAVTVWFPSCPLHRWTGWACPGCGTLRAVHALLHLRIAEAFHDNALAMVSLSGWLGGLSPARFLRRGQAPCPPLVVILAFGVLRNIPVRPFTWLLP